MDKKLFIAQAFANAVLNVTQKPELKYVQITKFRSYTGILSYSLRVYFKNGLDNVRQS